MNVNGIIRKFDELGRVVVPMELRRLHGIEAQDEVEVISQGDFIVLRKVEKSCCICKGRSGLQEVGGHLICQKCAESIGSSLLSRNKDGKA